MYSKYVVTLTGSICPCMLSGILLECPNLLLWRANLLHRSQNHGRNILEAMVLNCFCLFLLPLVSSLREPNMPSKKWSHYRHNDYLPTTWVVESSRNVTNGVSFGSFSIFQVATDLPFVHVAPVFAFGLFSASCFACFNGLDLLTMSSFFCLLLKPCLLWVRSRCLLQGSEYPKTYNLWWTCQHLYERVSPRLHHLHQEWACCCLAKLVNLPLLELHLQFHLNNVFIWRFGLNWMKALTTMFTISTRDSLTGFICPVLFRLQVAIDL